MSKELIDLAKNLLDHLHKHPDEGRELIKKSEAETEVKPVDLAKSLLEHLKKNPNDIEILTGARTAEIKKCGDIQQKAEPTPAPATIQTPKPPKPQIKPKPTLQLDGMARRNMLKEELRLDWKPRFRKSETPVVSKCGEMSKTLTAKVCKEELKSELRQPWKPRHYKAEFAPTLGDVAPTAMKAQKDPTAKPVMADKIIKPSDIKDYGAAGMAIPAKAVFKPKKKPGFN